MLRITNHSVWAACVMSVMKLLFYLSLCAGEEAAVSVLYRCQRKRMGDGISNSLHQGHRWSSSQRGATGRAKERSCEYLHKKNPQFSPTFRIIKANSAYTVACCTQLDLTWILRVYSEIFWCYSVVFCHLDPEDICWQPVSHYAPEAVIIRALPGHECLQQ